MPVHNFMEDVVYENIESVMRDIGSCQCEKCRDDVMAIALNTLAPKYTSTEQGSMYVKMAKFNSEFQTKVLTAIAIAAERVKSRPKHEAAVK